MTQQVVLNIVLTISGILVTSSVGYLANKAKTYHEKLKTKQDNEEIQNVAIRTILKSQLVKTYFVYSEAKEIPDYIYEDFLDMLKIYESFNGNGHVHILADKMKQWEIVETGILK